METSLEARIENKNKLKKPKVSIIIPTYNRARYLKECIESLLNQDYPKEDYEIIVVDDGSIDNTEEIVKGYDNSIRYFKKMNGGSSSARNLGIMKARGEYISTLDSDDVALPNRIRDLAGFLDSHKDIDFVHAREITIDRNGKQLKRVSPIRHFKKVRDGKKEELTPEYLKKKNYIHAQTVMFRNKLINNAGLLDEHLLTAEDYDFWLRISEKCKMGFLDKEVVKYRWHSGCKTIKYQRDSSKIKTIIRNKAKLRRKFGKDLRLLSLTSLIEGGQGRVTTGLAEALFKEGLTDITIVKNPQWYEKKLEFYVKELDSNILSKKNDYYKNGWRFFDNFNKLLDHINAESYDMIHLQCNQYAREIPLLKKLKKPIIYTCHSLLKYERDACGGRNDHNDFNITVQETNMHAADKIQAMSNVYNGIITGYYPHLEDRIFVIPNAKNFLGSNGSSKNNGENGNGVLFSVGRLVIEKGHNYLIEAMANVKERYPKVRLYIAGKGNIEPELSEIIRKKNLEDNVKLIGWLDDRGLKKYYRKADMFIMPSLEENYPLVILEAVNFKLPIICSNVGGLQEILNENECIKIPPKDPKKISDAILYYLANHEEAKKHSSIAYQKYVRKTWRSVAKQMLNVYEEALNSKSY